ncbi:seryl-tRNA synthetase [Talaromyces stipitatus ATCC 10500]|uniref:serine--tRNA ligase n=1 Tax=Talaromyces stipitatus (strain ATCC 10500 / CBS 375.48 / QM 6759 / NRRL 1006) TaxID=441959 RepID=B8MBY0_TALSN|nr:seryl-tRNA synthetase [Talaromyces stipitatus ATCC 10500]EED18426.1 seryl-tRNA synthetase [Talaromyces stipitatus ATCC 10500]
MLDVNDFVADRGGDINKIRESQRRRYAPESVVDEVLELFEAARRARYETTQISSKINAVQKEIGQKKKNKEDASELLKQKADLEKEKKESEENALAKEKERDRKIKTIGNYVHDSVPISDNEDNNVVERVWAPENVVVEKRDCLSHHEVLTRLDGYDPERGVKIVGHRGYCLTGYGLFLNLALVNYGLEFLFNKGYKPNQPPQFMLKDAMAKTAQLEQFDEELYKVSESEDKETDKYLIATSEQPLSALHSEEWLIDSDLPVKYAGYSTCYRKEAGSHGKDAWGIFRVHQFEKIEQFVLTKPDKSWEAFDEMIATSEEFYKSLGLPYQVVSIVSGALNNAAAKKYDLEAWFPFQGEYKELVSCSNCTDYQTRELEIRYGAKKADAKKSYVHALNATLCATERTLCCILENYQTEDGINVPAPLQKYIPGAPTFLPYTRELPKDTTSAKKGKGGDVAGAAKQLKDLKV